MSCSAFIATKAQGIAGRRSTMSKDAKRKLEEVAGLELPVKKNRSGPSGWKKYNEKRKKNGRIDPYVPKTTKIDSSTSTSGSASSVGKPSTRNVECQTELVDIRSNNKVVRDVCVGEHVSGEPFIWRGIFDLP